MISVYRAGNSLIHRIPTGAKLLAFMVFVFAITLVVRNPVALAIGSAVFVAVYLLAGFSLKNLIGDVWHTRYLVLFMVIPQLLFLTPELTLINTGRVLLAVLFGTLLSLTTRTSDILDSLDALFKLGRKPWAPEWLGLLLAITITTIPILAGFVKNVREAQIARGARPRVMRMALPVLVLSLKHADDLADAMSARGIAA